MNLEKTALCGCDVFSDGFIPTGMLETSPSLRKDSMSSSAGRPLVALVSALLAWPLLPSCSKDSGKSTPPPDMVMNFCDLPVVCQDIVRACHAKDDTTNAEIHNCHETGHDVGTEAACAPIHDHCVEICNAAPDIGIPELLPSCDGGTSDAGPHDAGHG